MKTPEPRSEPKTREALWRETVFGGFAFLAGCAMLGFVTVKGHENASLLIVVGAGLMSFGAFMTNKKLTKEWLAELRETVPFLRKSSD